MSLDITAISHSSLQINEDITGYNTQAIWILDGATSISGRKKNIDNRLESDASWFVQKFSNAFSKLQTQENLTSAIKSILKKINEESVFFWDDWNHLDIPSASFAAAFYSENKISLYNLGDCRVLYQIDHGKVQHFGQSNVVDLDHALLNQYRSLRQKSTQSSHKDIWSELVPQIRFNRSLMNKETGYWILSPDAKGIDHLQKIEIEYHDHLKILLSTDGLYRLVDTYNLMDDEEFFNQAFQKGGLENLLNILRDTEINDLDATIFPRVKLQDDASAILLTMNK